MYDDAIECTTEEFWDYMCSVRFYRIDKNYGAIGDKIYHVEIPPEDVDGFIENVVTSIFNDLNLWGMFKKYLPFTRSKKH